MILLDIKIWVDIAQLATTIITLIGIILSFWISRKTLKEVQKDRIYSQKPFLLFEYGGQRIAIDFKTHPNGQTYIRPYWPSVGNGRGVVIPVIGSLKNYGTGPAIDMLITWVVEEIYIKGESFQIDSKKRQEEQYSNDRNTNPLNTTHLSPGQETGIHLIPNFISSDYEMKIERADGYFIISYSDTIGNKYKTYQKFHVFTDYKNPSEGFHTTFSDLIRSETSYE